MIVASLLLIPVAVLFLALGLVNGSSGLLITSIVVSLLAAVALVIGTRQAASRRAAESSPAPAARPPRREPPPAFAEDSASAPAAPAGESVHYEEPAPADRDLDRDLDADTARAAGARDAASHLGDRRESRADYVDSDSTADSGVPAGSGSPADPDEDLSWRPAAAAAETQEQADEFAEPDDDDPDDEPLPQSVRPADAVLVARFDTEVMVVDGRPRYHMADCPHLVGRLTEALPVNEAVQLGFSPCGLCRPVDRLVAAVAQHR
ncbi:hypothetical protein [Actinoplanes subglobosus]|uniref:Clumping factor A n=1 Tax=Actinoplanes subglobosus TaxID=1547892 RepID=A0ABV8IKV2_9ACTN